MSSPNRKEESEENSDPIETSNVASPVDHLAEKVTTSIPTKKRSRKSPKSTLQSKRRKLDDETLNKQDEELIDQTAVTPEPLEEDPDSQSKNLLDLTIQPTSSSPKSKLMNNGDAWGYLISQSAHKKNVRLAGRSFVIGKGSNGNVNVCNLALETTQVENICEIFINDDNEIFLKCNSSVSPVFLNRVKLTEGQMTNLESGDIIGIFGKRRYIFFFTTQLMKNLPMPNSDQDLSRNGVFTRSMAKKAPNTPPFSNFVFSVQDLKDRELVNNLTEEFQSNLIHPDDIDVSLDNFPHYLTEDLKDILSYNAYMYLKSPSDYLKYVENLPNITKKFLLSGPPGSESYQELLVKALAKQFHAKLFIMNSHLFSFDSIANNVKELPKRKMLNYPKSLPKSKFPTAEDSWNNRNKNSRRYYLNPSFALHSIQNSKLLLNRSLSTNNNSHNSHSDQDEDLSHLKEKFQINTRIQFKGFKNEDSLANSYHECPEKGAKGRILITFEDNPKRFGIRFDNKIKRGGNLGGLCEKGFGAILDYSEIELEKVYSGPPSSLVCESILNVISKEDNQPCILYIKDSVLNHPLISSELQSQEVKLRLTNSKNKFMVIGSSTHPENKPDKNIHDMMLKSISFEMTFLDQLRLAERSSRSSPKRQKLFSNTILITPPVSTQPLKEWKKMIERDSKIYKYSSNLFSFKQFFKYRNVICSIPEICDFSSPLFDLFNSKIYTMEEIEKIAGLSILRKAKQMGEEGKQIDGPLLIDSAEIEYAIRLYQKLKSTHVSAIQNIEVENEFEKKLLQEVIPANQVNIHFEDIGALDKIKETLYELVLLPLQRPELFRSGNLTKPCKGILLFGPPGTGKTMLAKAIAKESGANFLNINISSITSKWFGEGEKFARAVFTLASKITPCVIFIDEVDSLLGKRDSSGEHEAMRKIKNEFMQMWDGLRTSDTERVLVLAATNRPFDLDDAVLRRLPKRMLVDLPDVANREKIIRVVLSKERIEKEFSYQSIAEKTEGFSGSDLKNLCITAAYIPIREYLKNEKDQMNLGVDVDQSKGPAKIRALTQADFDVAMKEMSASVSENAFAISELRRWNDTFGEGGKGRISLSYFM